jgi:hypothetical protein
MVNFERETLRRLPLAEAAYRLVDYVTQEDFLAGVFERHRGAAYEKVISFPLFVQLIGDALLEHQGSGHRSFARARAEGILPASLRALYGKLARLPLRLSQGWLAAATRRLETICPPVSVTSLPACVQEFEVLLVDGKKIKHVAHRLKRLRPVKGQVLAAKLLVALDVRTGLAVALTADADGETSDAPLVPDLLAQVQERTSGPRLWVEDRQFCDLVQPHLLGGLGDHYVIRYNAKVGFHAAAEQAPRRGVDAAGREYQQEWGWLGSARDKRRLYVRRITLYRPGEESVILVTDLLDADRYPAADLLAVYLLRWGIERVFQQITDVFHLRTLIGSTPQAGVFQAAFCLLLYNVLVVLRWYLSEAQQRPPETISTENVFYDVRRQLVALHEVLPLAAILPLFTARLAGHDLRQHLRQLLAVEWHDRWLKAPAKKRRRQPSDAKEYLPGGHTSVYRLLQEARNKQRQDTPPGGK